MKTALMFVTFAVLELFGLAMYVIALWGGR